MNSEFDALKSSQSSTVTSSSNILVPCEQFAGINISGILETGKNGTHPRAETRQSTVQQTSSEKNDHEFDAEDSRYLIIANVSKKPNIKTLIYSAAAHGFSVIIVGLPNLDVNDLHLAEGVIGAVENTSSKREKWRNVNSNHDMTKHSDCNPELNEKISGSKIDGHDDMNNRNGIKIDDSIRETHSGTAINSKGNHDSIEGSISGRSNKKLPFCSILRLETLLELKSFLVQRNIALMGIEIMDEGFESLSAPI